MSRILYVWVIAYIDKNLIHTLNKDIENNLSYRGVIQASIPTVRVLKKQLKGKNIFDEVPLLFNYGFIRVPLTWAINQDIMANIRENLSCVSSWVKDITKKSYVTSKRDIEDNSLELLGQLKFAYVRGKDVQRMIYIANNESIHSSRDIEELKIGSVVTLVGYPFEGMDAKILDVDKKKLSATVSLIMYSEQKEVQVSLDNILYTIYRGGYNEDAIKESAMKDYQEINYTGDEI